MTKHASDTCHSPPNRGSLNLRPPDDNRPRKIQPIKQPVLSRLAKVLAIYSRFLFNMFLANSFRGWLIRPVKIIWNSAGWERETGSHQESFRRSRPLKPDLYNHFTKANIPISFRPPILVFPRYCLKRDDSEITSMATRPCLLILRSRLLLVTARKKTITISSHIQL